MRESVQRAMFDYFGFEGQTAIVTGSGNGIGRATAIMLADLGANVMVCDIEGDSAKKVAEEITERGGAAVYNRCDVTKLEEIKETIKKTVDTFGNVDILVNNAAGFGGGKTYAASKAGMIGLAKELSQELAKHRINVNVLGTGLTDTRMAHLPGRSWEDETKGLPWYRVGTPKDQASAIVFLVSEAAEYITGQVLCPNGGAWM